MLSQERGTRPLGVFGLWAAFQAEGRCWAVSTPVEGLRPQGWRPFAAISHWPQTGARGQLHFRISRPKRPESAVLLRIDGRTFQLAGAGRDAWAPDAAGDREILQAMRGGLQMTVQTRGPGGGVVRDSYRLQGAASAMDAVAIACARQRRR